MPPTPITTVLILVMRFFLAYSLTRLLRTTSAYQCALSFHTPRRMRKAIPDALAFAIFIPGTFNLIGNSGYTPQKSPRKLSDQHCLLLDLKNFRR
jgi:hypothetical protein